MTRFRAWLARLWPRKRVLVEWDEQGMDVTVWFVAGLAYQERWDADGTDVHLGVAQYVDLIHEQHPSARVAVRRR